MGTLGDRDEIYGEDETWEKTSPVGPLPSSLQIQGEASRDGDRDLRSNAHTCRQDGQAGRTQRAGPDAGPEADVATPAAGPCPLLAT